MFEQNRLYVTKPAAKKQDKNPAGAAVTKLTCYSSAPVNHWHVFPLQEHCQPESNVMLSGNNKLHNCLVCMGGEETESIDTVKVGLPYALECNITYFADIMRHLSDRLPTFRDHTFVFTRSVTELPRKFDDHPNLVVFVMGDEWARVPTYASGVHAVFKAPGQHMKLALHRGWWRFNTMALLQYARQQAKRIPHHHRDRKQNIFAVPYGYYRLPERQQVTPINERGIDASFTGSLDHRNVLGGLIKTNKVLSRERMVQTVDEWKRGTPYNVDVKLSTFFPKAHDEPEFNDYPTVLMDTKICLSPRGTHLETYRLCEGMYYGCIVIAEEQPDHWFAKDSPAFIVDDWDTLPDLLDQLLGDPAAMEAQQQASLKYWDDVLAPNAVSYYIATRLEQLAYNATASENRRRSKLDDGATAAANLDSNKSDKAA